VVLKFGSSVLRSEADLPRIADEIKRHVDQGSRVVAVVSAMGESTELLIRRAHALGHRFGDLTTGAAPSSEKPTTPSAIVKSAAESTTESTAESTTEATAPAEAAFAALLATGEATSAALVGLALDNVGVAFNVLCAGRVGPFTRGPQLDARPYAFDAATVQQALARRPVAILPGFVGRDSEGHFSLLGRGGSDLTALFVAHSLQADRCCLLKDVDGIYEHDPALCARHRPRRYTSLDWNGARRLDDCILQQKAARFAYRYGVAFEVGACGGPPGTLVGAAATRIAATVGHLAGLEGRLAS
jgi:homoserine dehydrogenase